MKILILIALIFSTTLWAIHAQTTSQIEGYLEVYHPEDTTSIYIGREAGKTTDPSVVRNNTILGNFAGAVLTTGGGNSFFGKNAGKSTNTGFQNSFYGEDAGLNNTTAFQNSFFGMRAGFANTSGSANSFFGMSAGFTNTSGYANSFFGMETGLSNTTGYQNSFFGQRAGKLNTTGNNNSFVGHAAGFSNTTGFSNSFFGVTAGRENTSGSANSFLGVEAVYSNTIGFSNSFYGMSSGRENTSGSANSFFGVEAGLSNESGSLNCFFGYRSGKLNTSGINNSFVGHAAGFSNTSGSNNSFFGMTAGRENTIGERNSFFGKDAGYQDSLGSSNSYFGYKAGFHLKGSGNVCIGAMSGPLSDQGLGDDRLFIDNDSTNNPLIYGEFNNNLARINGYLEVCHPEDTTSIYIGKQAGRLVDITTDRRNTVLGNLAGKDLTFGNWNSFFGDGAGTGNMSGVSNSFFGQAAGSSNVTGSNNSFFGLAAGDGNIDGDGNSCFGYFTGRNITGSRNLCLGTNAGPTFGNGAVNDRLYIDNATTNIPLIYGEFNNDLLQINGTLTMGNTNYFGGNDDGVIRSSTANSSDLFLVSNDAVIIELDDDGGEEGNFEIKDSQKRLILKILEGGQFEFWNSAATEIMHLDPVGDLSIEGKMTVGTMATAGAATVCRNSTTGELTLCSSSIRYKEEIEKNTSGLQLISKLQPVDFRWKESGEKDLGLIAEEVAKVEPLLVIHSDDGEVEGVKYDRIGVLLVNAVKEQQAMIEALQEENKSLKEENTFFQQNMTEVLDAQQAAIEALQQKMEQSFRINSSDND